MVKDLFPNGFQLDKAALKTYPSLKSTIVGSHVVFLSAGLRYASLAQT